MTVYDRARAALEPMCASVSDIVCLEDPLPDNYIVLTPLDERPLGYAGDTDEAAEITLRACWYSIGGKNGKAKKMKSALRAAGFTIAETAYGYDDTTGHYITYQTAAMVADYESEE